MAFVAVKALNGFNYVRAEQVIAVQTSATGGAVLVLSTGALIQSTEASKEIAQRIEAVLQAPPSAPITIQSEV